MVTSVSRSVVNSSGGFNPKPGIRFGDGSANTENLSEPVRDELVRTPEGAPESRPPKPRFSWRRAGGHFIKGVLRPVKELITHPLRTGLAIAGALVVGTLAPFTVPLMLIAGAGFSTLHLLRGVYHAVTRYMEGNTHGAEQAFEDIGSGAAGLGMSAMGTRRGAMKAAEAKALVQKLPADQVANAIQSAKNLPFRGAVREVTSVLTRREGIYTWSVHVASAMRSMAFRPDAIEGLLKTFNLPSSSTVIEFTQQTLLFLAKQLSPAVTESVPSSLESLKSAMPASAPSFEPQPAPPSWSVPTLQQAS